MEDVQGRCERHSFEPAENLCRSCGYEFCHDCLVYTYGARRAPFCVQCAITAAGIRSNAALAPRASKHEIKKEIRARKSDPAPAPLQSPFEMDWSVPLDSEVAEVASEPAKKGRKAKAKAKSNGHDLHDANGNANGDGDANGRRLGKIRLGKGKGDQDGVDDEPAVDLSLLDAISEPDADTDRPALVDPLRHSDPDLSALPPPDADRAPTPPPPTPPLPLSGPSRESHLVIDPLVSDPFAEGIEALEPLPSREAPSPAAGPAAPVAFEGFEEPPVETSPAPLPERPATAPVDPDAAPVADPGPLPQRTPTTPELPAALAAFADPPPTPAPSAAPEVPAPIPEPATAVAPPPPPPPPAPAAPVEPAAATPPPLLDAEPPRLVDPLVQPAPAAPSPTPTPVAEHQVDRPPPASFDAQPGVSDPPIVATDAGGTPITSPMANGARQVAGPRLIDEADTPAAFPGPRAQRPAIPPTDPFAPSVPPEDRPAPPPFLSSSSPPAPPPAPPAPPPPAPTATAPSPAAPATDTFDLDSSSGRRFGRLRGSSIRTKRGRKAAKAAPPPEPVPAELAALGPVGPTPPARPLKTLAEMRPEDLDQGLPDVTDLYDQVSDQNATTL